MSAFELGDKVTILPPYAISGPEYIFRYQRHGVVAAPGDSGCEVALSTGGTLPSSFWVPEHRLAQGWVDV